MKQLSKLVVTTYAEIHTIGQAQLILGVTGSEKPFLSLGFSERQMGWLIELCERDKDLVLLCRHSSRKAFENYAKTHWHFKDFQIDWRFAPADFRQKSLRTVAQTFFCLFLIFFMFDLRFATKSSRL